MMSTSQIRLRRYDLRDGSVTERDDLVASDQAICIFINDEFYRALIATPTMIEELVVGHLLGEGVVGSVEDIAKIEVDPLRVNVELRRKVDLNGLNMSRVSLITTACGALTPVRGDRLSHLAVLSSVSVEAGRVLEMVRELNRRGEIFRRTGGTHSAMLCSAAGEVHVFAEDVGRHNAVDKVLGCGMLRGVDMSGCVLVFSGRQSSDIVLKAAHAGVPIVASMAGPLSSGIGIAESAGITLICFARGNRINVYTHHERVIPVKVL